MQNNDKLGAKIGAFKSYYGLSYSISWIAILEGVYGNKCLSTLLSLEEFALVSGTLIVVGSGIMYKYFLGLGGLSFRFLAWPGCNFGGTLAGILELVHGPGRLWGERVVVCCGGSGSASDPGDQIWREAS